MNKLKKLFTSKRKYIFDNLFSVEDDKFDYSTEREINRLFSSLEVNCKKR